MAQKVKKIFSFPPSLRGGTTKQYAYKEEFRALQGNYICRSFFKLVLL